MCNLKETDKVASKTTRSQWAKIFKKQVPLPTKVNLNKYWSKFGEIMSPSKIKVQQRNFQLSGVTKKKLNFGDKKEQLWQDDCTIKNRYRTCDDEIDENIMNELKEVLSINIVEVCRFC
ncbi:uncharacterized protein LOC143916440 [Arctopsyche grandis]|uniref:uncharacterized protein LOC143916440 n=1 Tax=Arctopsyche grandis TaxID=121162 RepID=UPI00406D9CBB